MENEKFEMYDIKWDMRNEKTSDKKWEKTGF